MSTFAQETVGGGDTASGCEVLRGAVPATAVERLRDAMDRLAGVAAPSREILYTHRLPAVGPAAGMAGLMDQWLNPHRRGDAASTRRDAEALRERVSMRLGSAAVLVQDVLMDKRARHGVFPWHQDFPFWPVDRPHGLVVWVTLDAVDEARGGLRIALDVDDAVGPPIDLHTGEPQPGFEERTVPRPARWFAPTLAPGDAVVFSPLAWHGSGRNPDDGPRRAWATTWLAAEVRWCHAAAPRHPIVRRVGDGERVSARGWAPLVEDDV